MSCRFSGVLTLVHSDLLSRADVHLAKGGHPLIHDVMVHADRSGLWVAALWQLQHMAFTPQRCGFSTPKASQPSWLRLALQRCRSPG